MSATEPKPVPEALDPRDYEIMCLKFRNEQMHRRIAVLEEQLAPYLPKGPFLINGEEP